MTNPVFPTIKRQDSKYYQVSSEDTSVKTNMDGGYVISRPKHTRIPRKTFKTGYTGIPNVDKTTLQNFYNLVRGGSVIFDWTDPVEKVVYQVRFSKQLDLKYTGMGTTQLWDVQLELEQA